MDKISPRLAIIQHFVDIPPETEFQRGYFYAMMDEALEDMEEAGSDIVEAAIQSINGQNEMTRLMWILQRKKTLA